MYTDADDVRVQKGFFTARDVNPRGQNCQNFPKIFSYVRWFRNFKKVFRIFNGFLCVSKKLILFLSSSLPPNFFLLILNQSDELVPMWRNQNFVGKLFWKTSYLSTSTGKRILHTASFFKLTKRQFSLLTYCWFYRSVTQITQWPSNL